MLWPRSRTLAHLLSSPATSPVSNLRRLISASAPAVCPEVPSFAVEEYLVSTCGLTRAQALKSPANPDAVLAFLADLGLSGADVASLVAKDPKLLCAGVHKSLASNVADLTSLGWSHSEIGAKVEYLKNTFRWSDAETGIAVSNAPAVLRKSKESLQRRSQFFFSELGLEPAYIAQRPVIISYSLEGRLRPRYYVVKFLKENGLVKRVPSWHTIFNLIEKEFMEMYICPHTEAAPHLAEDYAAACRGEMPTSFRFT